MCTYPKSREFLKRTFDGVPATIKRRILLETTAEFFGLDLNKPITPTPN